MTNRLYRLGAAAALLVLLVAPAETRASEGWMRAYGGVESEGVSAVAVVTGEGGDDAYLVGGYAMGVLGDYTPCVLKLNSSGDVLWQRAYGKNGWDVLQDLVMTPDGDYVMAANASSFGHGQGVWIVRLDSAGEILSQKLYSLSDYDMVNAIELTPDGGLVACGSTEAGPGANLMFALKLDAEGDVEWCHAYGFDEEHSTTLGYHIRPTPEGGYIFGGATNFFDMPTYDAWVLKLDSGGRIEWQRRYWVSGSQESSEFANSVALLPAGGYLIAGSQRLGPPNGYDIWILRLDALGNLVWDYGYGTPADETGNGVVPAGGGRFVCSGSGGLFGETSYDCVLFEIDVDGTVHWAQRYGGPGEDLIFYVGNGRHAAITASGCLLGADSRSFGAGEQDMWVINTTATGGVSGCSSVWDYAVSKEKTNAFQAATAIAPVAVQPTMIVTDGVVVDTKLRSEPLCPEFKPGDMNCDGSVDFGDINPFVLALSDPGGYAAQFPGCDRMNADTNGDGAVDFGDINPFVRLLSGQ